MEEMYNKHYISVDASGRVVDGWSDGPCAGRDATGAICINEEGGYQFRLLLTLTDDAGEPCILRTEENPALHDYDGIPLYKWDGEHVLPRTEEEIEADRPELPEPTPTPAEPSVWDELDAAYQEGVDSAYEQ